MTFYGEVETNTMIYRLSAGDMGSCVWNMGLDHSGNYDVGIDETMELPFRLHGSKEGMLVAGKTASEIHRLGIFSYHVCDERSQISGDK